MRVIVFELEVIVGEVKYALHIGIYDHARQFSRFARQLQVDLLEVVVVDVCVTKSVHEVACLEPRHLRHHH